MTIRFLDLRTQYENHKTEIDAAVQAVMNSCSFAGGPFVEKFEQEFAQFCGCDSAIGVGSGTEAIWLALLALDIGPGDEVITVPNTFIATVEAIHFCGAKPVFVDIDEKTYNMDPDQLKTAITKSTKAIIPVHIFGQMADMDPIMEIAEANGIFVIEDACQAHGAEYKGRKAGTVGKAGCFSFYPGKNLGAFGEAGAVVTNDQHLAKKIKVLRDHGQQKKYHHQKIGWNARMDGIQAAVLSTKLNYLADWNNMRRGHAATYNKLLSQSPDIITPYVSTENTHVYHVYAIRCSDRDSLMADLAEKEIQSGIHYPVPLHLQLACNHLGYKAGQFPVCETCMDQFVSLPMYPELPENQIVYVTETIDAIMRLSN
jgi:dTDP-4-amino-4,6-dideoxygalactose transaminase